MESTKPNKSLRLLGKLMKLNLLSLNLLINISYILELKNNINEK